MKTLTMALGLSLITLPSLSHADWQYTRWGMTADEIISSSKGAARKLKPSEIPGNSGEYFTTRAVGKFKTGPYSFEVDFRSALGKDSLRWVRMTLSDPNQYNELERALTTKHGAPMALPFHAAPAGAGGVRTLRWHTENDVIDLSRMEIVFGNLKTLSVWLEYSPAQRDVDL